MVADLQIEAEEANGGVLLTVVDSARLTMLLTRETAAELLDAIVLREGTPSFRTVGNHAGLFWFSMYRFNVSTGAPPAVPA